MNKRTGLRIIAILLTAALVVAVMLFASGAFSGGTIITEQHEGGLLTLLHDDTTDDDVSPSDTEDAEYVVEPNRESNHYIVVYLKSQRVVVYAKDALGRYVSPEKCFICSTGDATSPTRTGQYSILRRFRWRLLVGDVYGQYATSFSGSYLFHSVPYAQEDSSALDMAGFRALGSPASHGCVRLCVRDSKWIFDNCENGTQINIVDAECPLDGEAIPAIIEDAVHDGWDPSDPDESSPYNTLTSAPDEAVSPSDEDR